MLGSGVWVWHVVMDLVRDTAVAEFEAMGDTNDLEELLLLRKDVCY